MAGDLLYGRLHRRPSSLRPFKSFPVGAHLTPTITNVTGGRLKVMAEYDNGRAGTEQTGRQAVAVVTTTAGPLR
ncbi:hypothetical protein ACIRYZ_44735 [Kitasatospora sp. NPDC101155]|uniref:hypothetical protein n=1 Tax=Kitasatospora sp. NPDC101155 TaxID=3364097 RepID=UPI00380BEA74